MVRLLPPYVITEQEIDEALPLLEAAIAATVATKHMEPTAADYAEHADKAKR